MGGLGYISGIMREQGDISGTTKEHMKDFHRTRRYIKTSIELEDICYTWDLNKS